MDRHDGFADRSESPVLRAPESAHKAEHAVDLDTGAIVGITLQGADQGDTTTDQTLAETVEHLIAVEQATGESIAIVNDLVADKGYHSRDKVLELNDVGFRTYISEPDSLFILLAVTGRINCSGSRRRRTAPTAPATAGDFLAGWPWFPESRPRVSSARGGCVPTLPAFSGPY